MISIQIFYTLLGSGSKIDSQDTIQEIIDNFCTTSKNRKLNRICQQFRTEIVKFPAAIDELIKGVKALIDDDREHEILNFLTKQLDYLQELRANHFSSREKFISLVDPSKFPLLDTLLKCASTETMTDDLIIVSCLTFLLQNSDKQPVCKQEVRRFLKKLETIIKEAFPDIEKEFQNQLGRLESAFKDSLNKNQSHYASEWVGILSSMHGMSNLLY